MKPPLITASTMQELSPLIRTIGARRLSSAKFPETYEGKIDSVGILLAVTGIGKVNTAASIAALLEHHRPRLLINTGCAGAYAGSELAVGDLAVATTEVFGDEGVLTPAGWESLEFIGIPALEWKGNNYFNEFPLSLSASEKAMQLAVALGLPIKRGRFVTVSTCSGTKARGEELFSRFGGICENMEGAAAAQVALIYGVDCMEVRGISNLVEDRDMLKWDIPLAVERVRRFVLKFIEIL